MAKSTRTIKKINIDPDSGNTIIQFVGSRAIEAKALDFKMEDGLISYLLLDRLVHRNEEGTFEYVGATERKSYSVSGCVASELSLINSIGGDNNGFPGEWSNLPWAPGGDHGNVMAE